MIDPPVDAAYNVRATIPPEAFDQTIADYRRRSDEAVRGLSGHEGLIYDELSGQRLDIWGIGARPRPVFVVIHGGYWRMLSRHDAAFMAATLAGAGIATVSIDYGLAPHTKLEEIVRQVRAAVAWIHHHGGRYGLDPRRITVGGSSAGGHLAASTMTGGWQEGFGVPADLVRAALPISGLFDLRPLVNTAANDWLSLTPGRAAALSPALDPWPPRLAGPAAAHAPAAVIAVGEHDGTGFLEQSQRFHKLWSARADSELLVVPDRNHYDVFLDLAEPDTELTRALIGLIAGTAAHPAG